MVLLLVILVLIRCCCCCCCDDEKVNTHIEERPFIARKGLQQKHVHISNQVEKYRVKINIINIICFCYIEVDEKIDTPHMVSLA